MALRCEPTSAADAHRQGVLIASRVKLREGVLEQNGRPFPGGLVACRRMDVGVDKCDYHCPRVF